MGGCCSTQGVHNLPYYKMCIQKPGSVLFKNWSKQRNVKIQDKEIQTDIKLNNIEVTTGLEKVSLEIWIKSMDTTPFDDEEQSSKILKLFYSACDIIILCVDMRDPQSLKKILGTTLTEVEFASSNIADSVDKVPIFIIGVSYFIENKISNQEIIDLAEKKDWGFGFTEDADQDLDRSLQKFASILNEANVPMRVYSTGDRKKFNLEIDGVNSGDKPHDLFIDENDIPQLSPVLRKRFSTSKSIFEDSELDVVLKKQSHHCQLMMSQHNDD